MSMRVQNWILFFYYKNNLGGIRMNIFKWLKIEKQVKGIRECLDEQKVIIDDMGENIKSINESINIMQQNINEMQETFNEMRAGNKEIRKLSYEILDVINEANGHYDKKVGVM